jgi:hypothetical protein
MVEAFSRQPPELSPIPAVRAAMREAWNSFTPAEWEQIRQGAQLSLHVPEIRARAMNEFARTIGVIAGALASRTGRTPDDLRVRVLAGAVVGVMMSIILPENFEDEAAVEVITGSWFGPQSVSRIDEALALLEEGLPL